MVETSTENGVSGDGFAGSYCLYAQGWNSGIAKCRIQRISHSEVF